MLDAPAHLVAEVIDGTLQTHPRPSPRHAVASTVLGGELGPPFHRGQGGPGGWWIVFDSELHLEKDILVPELAGWCRERMPDLPECAYFTLTPDWACEVLSPSTRKLDLQRKRPIYAREGVTHLWLIDPLDRTLEAFERDQGHWLLTASAQDDEPITIRPFDAIAFSLADLRS